MVLENVRTTPVDNPEAAPIVRGFAQINKETIAFGIPHEPPTTPEQRQKIRPFEYIEKNRHQVLVSLPPFAITGYLHLAKQSDIRTALRHLAKTFIPISDARAAYIPNPGIKALPKATVDTNRCPRFLPIDAKEGASTICQP